ncbi:hypothetical protein [Jannaschia aquimarina]|nr:hypothetical protein [Jannaschia aquimarina]
MEPPLFGPHISEPSAKVYPFQSADNASLAAGRSAAQGSAMPVSRVILFLVSVAGWCVLVFGAWIAWRGAVLYENDAVLMGTGGGLALGGLLVIALTIGAFAQVSAARDLAAMRARLEAREERRADAPPPRGEPALRSVEKPKAVPRVEPRLSL